MADNDLDKYLENIGINMGEERDEPLLPESSNVETSPATPATNAEEASDITSRTESFLVNLLINFDPAYAVEINPGDNDELNVEVFGGDPGKIIGRNGRTLAALEYVTNAVINRQDDSSVRINIDVGGYKRRRDDRLRQAARKAAGRVRKTGRSVELDPMSAAERRVVHMEISEDPSVVSESHGEGRNRRVVIKPS